MFTAEGVFLHVEFCSVNMYNVIVCMCTHTGLVFNEGLHMDHLYMYMYVHVICNVTVLEMYSIKRNTFRGCNLRPHSHSPVCVTKLPPSTALNPELTSLAPQYRATEQQH